MFNIGDVLHGEREPNHGYWVIEAIEDGKAKLKAVDKLGRVRASMPRGPTGKRRHDHRNPSFETLARRYLWRRVASKDLPEGFVNPVKPAVVAAERSTEVVPFDPQLSFDVEQRKLVIDGNPLVFSTDWTVSVAEVEKALGYSAEGLGRAVRRWTDAGELREGPHFIRTIRPDGGHPLVSLTENGLYRVCLLTRQPIGVALRDFLSNEVLPAIQRGRAVAQPAGGGISARQLNASLEAWGHQMMAEFVRQLHERHLKALGSTHGRADALEKRLDNIQEKLGLGPIEERLNAIEAKLALVHTAVAVDPTDPFVGIESMSGFALKHLGSRPTPVQIQIAEDAVELLGAKPQPCHAEGKWYRSSDLEKFSDYLCYKLSSAGIRPVG